MKGRRHSTPRLEGAREESEGRRHKEIARGAGPSFFLLPSSFVLCLALLAPGASVAAQVMNDPTRPPPGYDAGEPDAGDAGGGIMLQTVLITPTQKAAIINGVLVRLGEKYGDAVLIAVAENEVVLRSGGARQVLKLHPAVNKRESGAAAATGATTRGGAPTR
jgi:MSHA biogenesis protein MshK